MDSTIIPQLTAVCEVDLRHDRCKGVVRSLSGDRPCTCSCHETATTVEQLAA